MGGSFAEKTVAVLGAAFKPDSDDVRDSPALDIAASISNAGATVRVYDPKAMHNAALRFPKLDYAPSVANAVAGSDAVLHLTEWREFRDLDPAALTPLVRNAHIIDGRLCLDPQRWRAAGWTYRDMEAEGFSLPVIEAHCEYRRSARYDDDLELAAGPLDNSTCELIVIAGLATAGFEDSFKIHSRRLLDVNTPIQALKQAVMITLGASSSVFQVARALQWLDELEIEYASKSSVT